MVEPSARYAVQDSVARAGSASTLSRRRPPETRRRRRVTLGAVAQAAGVVELGTLAPVGAEGAAGELVDEVGLAPRLGAHLLGGDRGQPLVARGGHLVDGLAGGDAELGVPGLGGLGLGGRLPAAARLLQQRGRAVLLGRGDAGGDDDLGLLRLGRLLARLRDGWEHRDRGLLTGRGRGRRRGGRGCGGGGRCAGGADGREHADGQGGQRGGRAAVQGTSRGHEWRLSVDGRRGAGVGGAHRHTEVKGREGVSDGCPRGVAPGQDCQTRTQSTYMLCGRRVSPPRFFSS